MAMKILFICKANVGRSQMAPAFFNQLSKQHSATGAGTHVWEKEGQPLHEYVIETMKDKGHDVSQCTRKQLTPEDAASADKIVVMTEQENLPPYVDLSKVIFWNIDDPKDMSLEVHHQIRDQILTLVEKLVGEIG